MQSFLTTLLLLCSCFDILGGALGDVGTARYYGPPYLPTKCYGDDQDQFPSDGQFAAVSNGIWDNGAACGRRYRMRCISGPRRPCRNRSIVMEVVDFCRYNPCRATMALPFKAFAAISIPRYGVRINVEYAQI
ncbi:EG45-like domain containing protein isoform X1 [Quercus robur]|uniref:EG45-like domain containing protein isoform X1 n=1 Tax=Quercus robur TaxID=38942 RepID=UPI00216322CC|nr:EG45-like domain containing protein isoform X1 [Quercus robur]